VNCNNSNNKILGRVKEKEIRTKDQSPGKQTAQKRQAHKEEGTTKYWNFHQLFEAYQLKKGEVNLIKKLQA